MDVTTAYQAPNEALPDSRQDEVATSISLLNFSSRVGRLRYLAYTFGLLLLTNLGLTFLLAVGAAFVGMESTIVAMVLGLCLGLLIPFVMAVRRFHDLDLSGWFSLLSLIPLVNIIVALYLLFAPGSKGGNRFGPQPPKNSAGVIIVGLVIPVLFVVTITAVAVPAYQQYIARAQQAELQPNLP